jgi:hypothetical protein
MHRIAISLIAFAGVSASADIAQVDEFSSLQFEGFNNLKMRTFDRNPVAVFDGMGEVLNSGGSWLHSTGAWGLYSGGWKGRTKAFEGEKMLGNTRGAIEYRFKGEQKSFGGMFATIANTPDATIKFFNGDQLVGTDVLRAAVGGDWSWNGWSSDEGFDRVSIQSNYGNRGGFLMHDAVRISGTQVPTPGSLAILATGFVIGTRRGR